MSETTQDSVEHAIVRVMQQVPYLQKQRGPGLNYTFAGEATLIGKLHDVMIAEGLSIHPRSVQLLSEASYKTAKQSDMHRVRVRVRFRLSHAPSGTHVDIQTAGEAADSGDKAIPKALTGAMKYALRQTFLIETGDDPDRDKPEFDAPEPTAKAPKAAPRTERVSANMHDNLKRVFASVRTEKRMPADLAAFQQFAMDTCGMEPSSANVPGSWMLADWEKAMQALGRNV